jgi:hypothetical protein
MLTINGNNTVLHSQQGTAYFGVWVPDKQLWHLLLQCIGADSKVPEKRHGINIGRV